tara:strand:- start:295 stop:768 length:474 start_codon:yes stop_codon:yes gene_type:complete
MLEVNLISFKNTGMSSSSNVLKRNVSVKPAGISTPLRYASGGKTIETNGSAVSQIKDNFRNLILTNKGERLGRYDYGADLRNLVSEISNIEDFESKVMENILQSTEKYMPMIELESFDSSFQGDTNTELRKITITVIYNIPLMNISNQKIDVTLYIV